MTIVKKILFKTQPSNRAKLIRSVADSCILAITPNVMHVKYYPTTLNSAVIGMRKDGYSYIAAGDTLFTYTQFDNLPTNLIVGNKKWTIVCNFYTVVTDNCILLAQRDTGSGGWVLRIQNSQYGFYDNGAWAYSSVTPSVGWHTLIVTSDGVGGCKLAIDGVITSTSISTSSSYANSPYLFAFGYPNPWEYAPANTEINFIGIFDTNLPQPLIQEISRNKNPWQLFEPRIRQVFSATQSGTSLVLNSLLASTAFTVPSLTQQNTLTNNNITVTQDIFAPTLVQQNILNSSELTSTQNVGTIVLTQQNILSLLSLLSTTQVEVIELVQQNTLAISSLLEETSLANTLLVQQNILNIANILSATLLDQITVNVQSTLGLNNLSSTVALTSAELTQQNTLALTNITQNSTLTAITLSMAGILVLSELLSTTNYSTITLTQQNVLVLDGITDSTTLTAINLIQQNSLALTNVVTNATVDSINLTQQNILVVSNNYNGTTLDNVVLSTIPLLNISNVFSTETLANINLTSSSTLIVDSVLHSTITTNLRLSLGANLLEGSFIYMLGKNSNIYVVKSMKDIYIIN